MRPPSGSQCQPPRVIARNPWTAVLCLVSVEYAVCIGHVEVDVAVMEGVPAEATCYWTEGVWREIRMVSAGKERREGLGSYRAGLYLPPPGQFTDILTVLFATKHGAPCPVGATCMRGNYKY